MARQDIRKSRKWLSAGDVGLLIIALLVLGLLTALNIYLARILPGGEQFYQRWSGARAFLVDRIEPYSTAVAESVQQVAYGRRALSSEYAYVLSDPFYIVLLYTPLALFSDFSIARGLWMLLSEAALIVIIYASLKLLEWEPPPWIFTGLFGVGLFGYFSLDAIVTGTPAVFLTLLCVVILLALRSFFDELAGAFLFLVAYQWEVGGLFFLSIMIFVFVNRRWKVLAGFGMSLFVAMVVSFLAYSGWGLPYVRAVLSDWYRGANLNFSHIMTGWFPESRVSIGVLTSIVLGIILFLEWLGSIHAHTRRVVWTASLSLAATPLMGFAIFPSNHVVLLPAFTLIILLVWERWTRQRVWFTIIILLLALAVPFGLYSRNILDYDPRIVDLLTVLPPAAAIVGLYWMRWWAVRLPRIWSDQIGVRK